MARFITVAVSTPQGLVYAAEVADATLATVEGSVHFAVGNDSRIHAPNKAELTVRVGTEFHTLVMNNASIHFHEQRLTVLAETAGERRHTN